MHKHWLFEPPPQCAVLQPISYKDLQNEDAHHHSRYGHYSHRCTGFRAVDHRPPAPNNVTVGGKNIGQDPDSNVRLQLRRDYGSEGF
jgi:hypothetical protein